MVYLTFVWGFNAVHRLWNSALSEAQNIETFAECASPSGHGHLYRLEVTCCAEVDSRSPVVLGRTVVSGLIDRVLKPKLHNANMDTVFGVQNFVSTGENVARETWRLLEPHVPAHVRLVSVTVVETPKNSFTYLGEREPRTGAVPMT